MGATILIVDDHAPVRTLMRRIAAQEPDFQVVGEAEDGAEAIRLTHELRPDIVLLDLAMPGVNGLEALLRIKAERPQTKVIIVTVHSEDAYRRAAADGGADAVLVKKTLMTTRLPAIRGMDGSVSPHAPRGITHESPLAIGHESLARHAGCSPGSSPSTSRIHPIACRLLHGVLP